MQQVELLQMGFISSEISSLKGFLGQQHAKKIPASENYLNFT